MKDEMVKFLAVILLILAVVSFIMLIDYSALLKEESQDGGKISLTVTDSPQDSGTNLAGEVYLEVLNNNHSKETGEVSSNNTEVKNE